MEKKLLPENWDLLIRFFLVLGGWLTNPIEKYAQVKLDHRNPGLDCELPPSDAWKKISKNTPDNGSRITYPNPKSLFEDDDCPNFPFGAWKQNHIISPKWW